PAKVTSPTTPYPTTPPHWPKDRVSEQQPHRTKSITDTAPDHTSKDRNQHL
ncbi:Hypothetical predicted protein, partial [Pelobates cultripes]